MQVRTEDAQIAAATHIGVVLKEMFSQMQALKLDNIANMEKIDKAKEDTYPERKDKYRGEPDFATIDKTPYRGYGFSEVIAN